MAASVGAAVQWIGDQVVEEAKYLYRIEKKVEELQEELKWMSSFLQDVDARRDRDARMREWVKQISLLANESEDIIEAFILKVEFRRRGGLLNKLRRCSCIIREAMTLHELGCDIDALTLRISKLTSRLQAYGITTIEQGGSWSVSREEQLRKSYAYHVEVDNIIGLDNDVEVVVNKLNSNESNIVALCGVGGLGKTTLAKKVYRHQYARQYFDAFAWASISRQCDVRGILRELIKGLTSEEVSNDQGNELLMDKLRNVQREKKCLVVLDDIWNNDTWNSLQHAFPNPLVGKLMFTTRNKSVAKCADDKALIHEQAFMSKNDARRLLERKLQNDPSNIFGPEHGDEANKLAEEMLEHCGGLPLAIAALGGILAKKKSLKQWRIVHKNIKSVLPNAKEGGLSCNKVLSLSYYDLPFHLKPCFLYLGIFREDDVISATKLIQLWMAEGFLSTDNLDNEDYIHQEGSSLEELGDAYLAELVDRSMVQVGSTRADGRIKSCRVHDLVRELCIYKAAEENFLKVLAKEDSASSSSSSIGMSTPTFTMNTRKRYRRFTVHGNDAMKKLTRFNAPLHVKSLYLWGNIKIYGESSISIKAVIKQFRLLRVLDLVGIEKDILPKGVGELVHLRYLSLRDSRIRLVPSSIVKLKSLQTLDLQCFLDVEWLPDIIWRMRQLRHVYMPKHIKEPSIVERIAYKLASSKLHQKGGVRLNHNIEVLCNFDGLHRLKDVAELAKLRKLSITSEIKEKEGLKHIKNSQSLSNGCLKYLFFRLRGELLVDEPGALCNFERLNKMKLEIYGRISSGSSSLGGCSLGPNMLPHSLTALMLKSTKIENPAMQILEKLPNLRKLTFGWLSYMGKEMRCSDGGFPKLVDLSLCHLENLEEWTIEKGAMPSLLRLSIQSCLNLKTFPKGLKFIPNLKNLSIGEIPKNFHDKVKKWKESAVKGDDRDGKGVAREVEDRGLSNSDKVVNHHIPTIYIWDELGD